MNFEELLEKRTTQQPILGWSHLFGEIQCKLTKLISGIDSVHDHSEEKIYSLVDMCAIIKNGLEQLGGIDRKEKNKEDENAERKLMMILEYLGNNIMQESSLQRKNTRLICEFNGRDMIFLQKLFREYDIPFFMSEILTTNNN